ncbi:MAG TPA: DNA topoisomerase IB, partial [Methylophilaceae bacterium]|nr:DNA topoisomerase IB [Methylophilaceae bacterium]
WICPWENGHIQATGRDDKQRKQYRYHARWREVRDEAKYARMVNFGRMLPTLRQHIAAALDQPGFPREKVLAIIIRLLELTLVRVGNEEYARTNKSFGLTTLRNKHVHINGSEVEFEFRGKSRVQHALKLRDRRLANIIKRMRDLPGQELFQYLDEEGKRHAISSDDVNDYLRTLTGEDYTAKDFRTWAGTMLATVSLLQLEQYATLAQAKKNVDQAIKDVAKKLGNTPRICRSCYVHPMLIESYMDEQKWQDWQTHMTRWRANSEELDDIEEAVLTLFEQQMEKAPNEMKNGDQ